MPARNPSSVSARTQNWREVYKAALLETDEQRMPLRIAEAEKALIMRERELFSSPGANSEEGQAVDDALYALQALRNCLKSNTRQTARLVLRRA